MKVLVTGWAGFIGSNLVRRMLRQNPSMEIVGLDCHTYAARPDYLIASMTPEEAKRFTQVRCDLRLSSDLEIALGETQPQHIIHLAAESHVCRSIEAPGKFFATNVMGTYNLLQAARHLWGEERRHIFHQVSTDEVYGSLELQEPKFREDLPYAPRSPYAASKAASDHAVMSYHHTYGMNTRITNCSNNFGQNQHEEKLIPKTILNILRKKPVTLYGSGYQIRDWLWVGDHCRAIMKVMEKGEPGGQYCIGGECELTNRQMVQLVYDQLRLQLGTSHKMNLVMTNDRPTDDYRYAIDTTKIRQEVGWCPRPNQLIPRIRETIDYYAEVFAKNSNQCGAV